MKCVESVDITRENVVSVLSLFASPDEQRAYQAAVPFVNVPTEMFCQWANDVYHPEAAVFIAAFSSEELVALAAFDAVFQTATAALPPGGMSLEHYITSPAGAALVIAAAASLLALR